MSLTIIAMTGILVGFLCLAVGFFMEEPEHHGVTGAKDKRARAIRKRVVAPRRKAA